MLLQPMLKESPDENSFLIIIDYYGLVFGFIFIPPPKKLQKCFLGMPPYLFPPNFAKKLNQS
jgi:hypothetical protein